ncbi:methyltransferase domain-containing protein [Massilia sp. DJPM01]|uniref:methyltransferase domain-containing protein n=1 Tax=Massilia sp. DJPM01 TaxID=3024404 RepID=UPI00259EFD14|nr:methyltransferase domain-containing protein [Massilia sp. DJPM01]MDM5180128.1 methyltransferase domain-containing protein [Massilia sp. DJPM01]
MNTSVDFFDQQFSVQVREGEKQLNPFELMAQPYLFGDVLDYGCGLGNLGIVAAKGGCRVLALDAAPTAISYLQKLAAEQGLPLTAVEADLRTFRIDGTYDTVVSIGLLMFLDENTALSQLTQLMTSVRPGGVAAINVLVEGTTFLDMFDAQSYYLFKPGELRRAFTGWGILVDSVDDFDAPRSTIKRFSTVIARRAA